MKNRKRESFSNLSPLDHRYYFANKEVFDALREYLSEEAAIAYSIKAEVALLRAHLNLRGLEDSCKDMLDGLEEKVTPGEVYEEEEKTHHNVRALVNVLKKKVDDRLAPYVHLGATSMDIIDTAQSMRIRDAVLNVVLPLLDQLLAVLIEKAELYAEVPQVGRTHGQHAVPVTVGFFLAEYISRLGQSYEWIQKHVSELKGKLSGAVGAYNASSMTVKNPKNLEKLYLSFLGLKPGEYATQIVMPEYLLRLFSELNLAFGVLANLADDLRHLQRTEIGEMTEFFGSRQVGSSTMPQKKNPWNSEHVKSLWKTFCPRIMTVFMDQISEHQRDLSNSASSRFLGEYLAGFCAAAGRMVKIIRGLEIHEEVLKKNLKQQKDFVLAEPAYILLSLAGEAQAHELIRKAVLKSREKNISLHETLKENPELWDKLSEKLREVTGLKAEKFFSSPELYNGRAVQITRTIVKRYEKLRKAPQS